MRFFILTICLIAGSLIGLKAQTYQAKNWWQVNGDVQSIVEDTINHKVYIGGGFNYIFKQDEPYGSSNRPKLQVFQITILLTL
jgi:hypothetical protein